jgi:hypothetical protein
MQRFSDRASPGTSTAQSRFSYGSSHSRLYASPWPAIRTSSIIPCRAGLQIRKMQLRPALFGLQWIPNAVNDRFAPRGEVEHIVRDEGEAFGRIERLRRCCISR